MSKRLCKEVYKLATSNKASYIEKLLPSICIKNNWNIKEFEKDDINKNYSILNQSLDECEHTSKPLHACKNLVNPIIKI